MDVRGLSNGIEDIFFIVILKAYAGRILFQLHEILQRERFRMTAFIG